MSPVSDTTLLREACRPTPRAERELRAWPTKRSSLQDPFRGLHEPSSRRLRHGLVCRAPRSCERICSTTEPAGPIERLGTYLLTRALFSGMLCRAMNPFLGLLLM